MTYKYCYIYPTLLQASNIQTNSWFDIRRYKNDICNKKKKKYTINYNYVNTCKIILHLTEYQKKIIQTWLDECIIIYNLTNYYIKTFINENNKKTFLNFINLRKILNPMINTICKRNNLNKHTADYSVKHCIEMYKSALSNCKFINKFNIRDLKLDRRRKNIVIEPLSVSKNKNSIFLRELGEIKSSLPLNTIKQNSILQYDSYKNTYCIITPTNINKTVLVNQYRKCGIDIGVRTYLTVFSKSETYEIGTNTYSTIDRIHERLDKIRTSYDKKIINKKQFSNLYIKYSDKLKNKISDMQNKTSNFLLSNFKTINIEKISIKHMVSNLTGNLREKTKRRLLTLSHYKLKMKLKQMAVKFDTKINEVSAYLTSKNCHNCLHTNVDLGNLKIFVCSKCKLVIDRDINAAINIYKNRALTRSCPLKKID
jgi:transposase